MRAASRAEFFHFFIVSELALFERLLFVIFVFESQVQLFQGIEVIVFDPTYIFIFLIEIFEVLSNFLVSPKSLEFRFAVRVNHVCLRHRDRTSCLEFEIDSDRY